MSPREKHIPDDAHRTSVCLTAEERTAIRWISEIRRTKKDKRTTCNDILVDALWYFLEKTECKTRRLQYRPTIAATGTGAVSPVPGNLKLGEIHHLPVKSGFRQQPGRNPTVMARVCDICGKGPQFGNTISHAHNVSKRRWNVNLRPVHAKVGAATKHMRVCTSCLRSGKVVKA